MGKTRRQENRVNPYEPPVALDRRTLKNVRSFQVGVDEISTIFVQSSYWTGITTQATDAAGISGPRRRGACQFEVGERERHRVRIEIDSLARVNAYVDGELVEANLFAGLRALIFSGITVAAVLLLLRLRDYYRKRCVVDNCRIILP